MKLVLIITDYGSFNNFLGELAVQMLANNHEVFLITSDVKVIQKPDKYDYLSKGLRVTYVDFPRNFNPLSHFRASKKIKSTINEIKPDLVHAHFTTGVFTTVFSGRLNFKTIATFHGLGYPVLSGFKKSIFKFVEQYCFNRIDEIWLLNKFDYNVVKKSRNSDKAFLYKSKGLGCDLEKFDPKIYDVEKKQILKSEFNITEKDFVIIFIGRYVYFKGYHLTVKSFLELSKSFKNLKLITIGGGDPIHPTGLSQEEETERSANKNIINIGFTDEIAKYLSISDLLVFPSFKEGMPVCIIESLAMGVPVLTSNSRGCNDLVFDNYNGFLVKNHCEVKDIELVLHHALKDYTILDVLKNNIKSDRATYSRQAFVNEQITEYNKSISLKNNSVLK